MPILNDVTLDQIDLPNSHYGYSAAKIEALGATEYTTATIVVDVSGSTQAFKVEMEACIAEIISACKYSARADNLLLRLVQFDTRLDEIHGFKLLENCNTSDYSGVLRPGGNTALYDAAENAISAAVNYAGRLAAGDLSANAILFVMTDGMDNASKLSAASVKRAMDRAISNETLGSIVSILIGVNVGNADISRQLKDFKETAGFNQYIEIDRADRDSLAGLARFVSKSISVQSQVLMSGGSSSKLVF
jgi:uncharacterized protein YegL